MSSNLKKEDVSSGRVQVWRSSLRDPWGSFVESALTLALKSDPETFSGAPGARRPAPLCSVRSPRGRGRVRRFCPLRCGPAPPTPAEGARSSAALLLTPLCSLCDGTFRWLTLAGICFSSEIGSVQAAFAHENLQRPLAMPPPPAQDADR